MLTLTRPAGVWVKGSDEQTGISRERRSFREPKRWRGHFKWALAWTIYFHSGFLQYENDRAETGQHVGDDVVHAQNRQTGAQGLNL